MAIVVTVPNHYKYLLKTKQIDESSDTYKIILMNTTFAFDKDDARGACGCDGGSTGNRQRLHPEQQGPDRGFVTENDTTDKAETRWSNVSWTASGGSIGPSGAAIIYNDSVAGDPIACCIDLRDR